MNFQWITQFFWCLRMMDVCHRNVSTMGKKAEHLIRLHDRSHTHPYFHIQTTYDWCRRTAQKTLITFSTIDATLSAVKIEISKLYTIQKSEGRLIRTPTTSSQHSTDKGTEYTLCSLINKFPVKLSLLLAFCGRCSSACGIHERKLRAPMTNDMVALVYCLYKLVYWIIYLLRPLAWPPPMCAYSYHSPVSRPHSRTILSMKIYFTETTKIDAPISYRVLRFTVSSAVFIHLA